MKFRVCVIGTSQSGKSTVGQMLSGMCGGGFFDTVDMLKEGLAAEFLRNGGVPSIDIGGENEDLRGAGMNNAKAKALAMAEVMRYKTDKPEYRSMLMDYGMEMEKTDPLFTVAEPLRRACFVAGTRTEPQLVEMRRRVDWVIYVSRDSCPTNETDRLGPLTADIIISNNGTYVDLHDQLIAFLKLYGPGTANLELRRVARERIDVDLEQKREDVRPSES